MPGFVSRSACRGRRPAHLASRRHRKRPLLIAKLLRDRHVARFIIAPAGFGKTGMALEYAETVFSFAHVFWINGKSPCFIRDLDAGSLADECLSCDPHAKLAVFEDVPLLDSARVELLSAVFDRLLEAGCEVVATCVPANDSLALLQRDRIRLGVGDLLLSDEELEQIRDRGDANAPPSFEVSPSERVPGLVWREGPFAAASFLEGIASDDLPADLLLALVALLILCEGALDDLLRVCAHGSDLPASLASDYPFLGIDVEAGEFAAHRFEASDIARAFRKKVPALVDASRFDGRDALGMRLADLLMERSFAVRACEVVGSLCSRAAFGTWVLSHNRALIGRACLAPSLDLLVQASDVRSEVRGAVLLACAERCYVLGRGPQMLAQAKRAAFDPAHTMEVRVLALLLVARGESETLADRAEEELAALVGPHPRFFACPQRWEGDPSAFAACVRSRVGRYRGSEAFWLALAQVHGTRALGLEALSALWGALVACGADRDALSLAAGWMFNEALRARRAGAICSDLDEVEAFVRGRLEEGGGTSNLFAALAGLALEQARASGVPFSASALAPHIQLELRQMEVSVLAQRRVLEQRDRDRRIQRMERLETRPDAFLDPHPDAPRIAATLSPMLVVRLFGMLDVRIGEAHVDSARFRRQKVKCLLALLVLNRGREVSRDALVQALWPESDMVAARKNFYTIWSQLRTALSLPDGTCPYLVRHQNGCSINDRLLESDVERFEGVCRDLLFKEVDLERWAETYRQVEEDFGDDLMPSETDNELIVAAREECRARLVDALIAASQRLVGAGGFQQGLWFARSALRRDRTREDAYLALIRAQTAAGQRTAALMTYLSCRRVLRDELGIDPSPEIDALYRTLIDAGLRARGN